MGLLRYYLLGFFLLIPALGCAQRDLDNYDDVKSPQQSAAIVQIEQIAAEKGKKKYEFVEIGGEIYPVSKPWLGRKITADPPELSELKQIPTAFTYNQTKLYLEKNACDAFVRMAEQAIEADVHLLVHSGYRSVRYQRVIFNKLMKQGRTWEDLVRYVAPPGYSEHMLGRAVDLYPSNWKFAETNEFQWLQENGSRFGFFETYPEKNDAGFPWESWHWNYVGNSEDIAENDITSKQE